MGVLLLLQDPAEELAKARLNPCVAITGQGDISEVLILSEILE